MHDPKELSPHQESDEKSFPQTVEEFQFYCSRGIVFILAFFGFIELSKMAAFSQKHSEFWLEKMDSQFKVVICIPVAGLAALFIALVLKISNGPIEFEAFGLKLKGGAAPIVFWIICYFTIIISIKMLWN